MAKQNVSFIERHVEKLVIGASGATLAAVVFLYVISTPYSVEVNGEAMGPDAFYQEVRQMADSARNRLRTAEPEPTTPEDGGNPTDVQVDLAGGLSPYDKYNLPKEFTVAFAPLGPAIPEAEDIGERGRIELAQVLPPGPVAASVGRAFVQLPQTVQVEAGSTERPPESLGITANHHWATVFGMVDRQAQRRLFEQAGYAFNRHRFIIADVEAERQHLLPNGEWSEPVVVRGLRPLSYIRRDTVELREMDDGTIAIEQADADYIQRYRQSLETPEAQAEILRPPFQSYLSDKALLWQVPALPGETLVWEDFGVARPMAEGSTPRPRPRPERPTPAPRPGRRDRANESLDRFESVDPEGSPRRTRETESVTDRPNRGDVVRQLRDARQAIDKKEYLEAQSLLNSVLTGQDANPNQRSDAERLLNSIRPELDRLALAEQAARQRSEVLGDQSELGEDIEPVWLTDTTVAPGKTYRYRLRLVAFNQYVGLADRLKNKDSAGKVVVLGDWSEWTSPVFIKPELYLFFTAIRPDNAAARVEMQEWMNGDWTRGSEDKQVGDVLGFKAGRHTFEYSGVIVGINPQTNYRERDEGRDGAITYRPKESAAMVFITPDGDVEERVAAEDVQRKKDLLMETKEEEKLLAQTPSLSAPGVVGRSQPGGGRPGPQPGFGDLPVRNP